MTLACSLLSNCLLGVKCCTRLCFSEVVDLSDESGNLKNLLEHKGEYATKLLKARHSFILIKVDSKCLINLCKMSFHIAQIRSHRK